MNSLAKSAIALALLVAAPLAYTQYKRYPVDSFCRILSTGDSREQVLSTAEVAGLSVNPLDRNSDRVHIFNQMAPWFRFACVVTLDNNLVVAGEVMAAD